MRVCFLSASLCTPLNSFYVLFIGWLCVSSLFSSSFVFYKRNIFYIYDVKQAGLRTRTTRNVFGLSKESVRPQTSSCP